MSMTGRTTDGVERRPGPGVAWMGGAEVGALRRQLRNIRVNGQYVGRVSPEGIDIRIPFGYNGPWALEISPDAYSIIRVANTDLLLVNCTSGYPPPMSQGRVDQTSWEVPDLSEDVEGDMQLWTHIRPYHLEAMGFGVAESSPPLADYYDGGNPPMPGARATSGAAVYQIGSVHYAHNKLPVITQYQYGPLQWHGKYVEPYSTYPAPAPNPVGGRISFTPGTHESLLYFTVSPTVYPSIVIHEHTAGQAVCLRHISDSTFELHHGTAADYGGIGAHYMDVGYYSSDGGGLTGLWEYPLLVDPYNL